LNWYLVHSLFGVERRAVVDRKSHFLLFIALAVLLSPATVVPAQQNGDVTVIIKSKSNPANPPTLLVMCDLACTWKLDGEEKGHIEAGKGVKISVESGQHMVEAATEDGVDAIKKPTKVNPTGQTMVNIELWPIRYARLADEQQAREAAAQTQDARLRAERNEQEEAVGFWIDPDTGLMWTKRDNGSSVGWKQALHYCRNLQLGGHADWRLPTIDELQRIYDSRINVPGRSSNGTALNWHIKGDIELTGNWELSSTTTTDELASALEFSVDVGKRLTYPLDSPFWDEGARALCVRMTGGTALHEQEARERIAREEVDGVWTDPATGLMWTRKDKGNLNWKDAETYCQRLKLGGHTDWRLPSIDELEGIYEREIHVGPGNVEDTFECSSTWIWSSSRGDSSKQVLQFDFKHGGRFSGGTGKDWTVWSWRGDTGALCVRRAE
jgi:hypothetical protein